VKFSSTVSKSKRRLPGVVGAALAVLCGVAPLAPATAGAQDEAPSLSAARVTAQIAGGTLAAPVAFFGGGFATKRAARALGASDAAQSRAGYIGAYTSTWLATAAVPAAVAGDGRFPAALAGSALGMLASVGTARLGNRIYDGGKRDCGIICWTLGAAVVALPSIGASLAYDQSRR